MLVSAIPEHLQQCPRKIAAKTPPGFQPPFPAYSASFPKDTKDLVFAVIGAQYTSASKADGAAVAQLTKFTTSKAVDADARPQFAEWASVTDNKGYYNIAHLAYWPSKTAYEKWAVDSGFQQWWDDLDVESQSHGWFLEIFFPTIDRFETVFSNNEVPEGAAHMRECVRGPIQEHVYWGSMRDRMAAAQDDELAGEKVDRPTTTSHTNGTETNGDATKSPRRVKVGGKHNLAIIRSFGLALFDELGSLEGWAKQHSTHLEIFGGFLQYAKKLENNVSLRLFHEVLVLKPEQQLFEYVGSHPGTGLLAIV